ncbi:MAG: hypothetical protein LCH61_12270 [Proteobacteria bacterium]|nr:hypothetical protein [Pseudomonadota bacterium]
MTAHTETCLFPSSLGQCPAVPRAVRQAEIRTGSAFDRAGARTLRITADVLDHHRREAAILRREAISHFFARLFVRR